MRSGRGRLRASILLLAAMLPAIALLPATMIVAPAYAVVDPDEVMDDPALEARARALSKELRCLVCQNQSIDDSNADLARDLRHIVRERLIAGDSDAEIIDYVTARYGDFVLLRPPMKPETWGLWYGPLAILLVSGTGLALFLRRRRDQASAFRPDPLNADEQARLDDLLSEGPAPEK